MEMVSVLVPALCLLSGSYAQEWDVTFAPRPLTGWVGSCVTIPCSYTYPKGETVRAVQWTLDREKIVYHSEKHRIRAPFKWSTNYLGDWQNNCSLQLASLRLTDQGTYHFRFETWRDAWTSKRGQWLNVSASPCQPFLRSQMASGPSLICSMEATCLLHPSWSNADGAHQRPGQIRAGSGVTELPVSPSQLSPGVVLRCQVDGYQNGCNSDQSQPPGPVALDVPRVEVLQSMIKEGDGFMLHCRTGTLRSVASYIWSHGDLWLSGAEKKLQIDKAGVSDGGSYSCGAWISGPGWAYLSLSVRKSVEVQHAPKDVNITATPRTILHKGTQVKLTCHFSSGIPTVDSYAWYKDNASLGVLQPELVLPGVTAKDAGEYRCEARNQIGAGLSPPFSLTFQVTPSVWPSTSAIGGAVVGVILLLVGLAVIIAWRKRRRKYQGMDNNPSQPGPREAPASECIYENTQHCGMEKPACSGPPRLPSSPSTEQYQETPADMDPSHIYSQPTENSKALQADPDEVYYSTVQLQHSPQKVEPDPGTACTYAEIKR